MTDGLREPPNPADEAAINATAEKLTQFSTLLMKQGPEAPEVIGFLQAHSDDPLFLELAEESRALEREIGPSTRQEIEGRRPNAPGGRRFVAVLLGACLLAVLAGSLVFAVIIMGNKANEAVFARQEIQAKDSVIGDLRNDVAQKDTLLNRFNSDPKELARIVKRLDEQEDILKEFRSLLNSRDQTIDQLTSNVKDLKASLAASRTELASLWKRSLDSRVADCMALDILFRNQERIDPVDGKKLEEQLHKALAGDLNFLQTWALKEGNESLLGRRGAVLMLGRLARSTNDKTAQEAQAFLRSIRERSTDPKLKDLSEHLLQGDLNPLLYLPPR